MAIVDNELTTIGGMNQSGRTGALLSLKTDRYSHTWKEVFPPMPTARTLPTAITTDTKLVVAGGKKNSYSFGGVVDVVEVLDSRNPHRWYAIESLPIVASFPQMTLCDGHFYFSEAATVYKLHYGYDDKWTRLANIPVGDAALVTVKGRVLAIGGLIGNHTTAAIHCYDVATDSWSITRQLPIPLSSVLTAVLPTNEVVVAGGLGKDQTYSYNTYIIQ